MRPIFSFLIVLLIISACARNISKGSSNGQLINEYEEDLSRVRPKTAWEKPDDIDKFREVQKTVFSEPKNENKSIEMAIDKIAAYNTSITEMPGYRLQVFAGNSRGDFENAKSYLLQHFPELEIYESYSQPTYRLKAGDFLKKMDAERYYSSIVSRFSASKIIMDEINVQKSLKIN
jgi:hypothetical protein